MNGLCKYFFANGKLKSVCNYVDNKKEGEEILYYNNGSVKTTRNYVNDILEGPYKEFNLKGKLISLYSYIEGEKNILQEYKR